MTPAREECCAAVIGIGCRFPGGVNGPSQLWEALIAGRDLVTVIPQRRWEQASALLHPDQRPEAPWPAGVVDIDAFDREFFGIGAAEAAEMDPQQRLLLEVTVEALADAGIAASRLAGRTVGVYVGAASFDQAVLGFTPGRRASMHTAGGSGMAVLANRISYCLDLRGASITVDTACSSSLTAAHYACRDLARGEVELAIAAGTNILLAPGISAAFADGGVLSAAGRCHTFDADADGYVRSEGAGVVVLKPAHRAVADTDRVYAVVAGSALNSDGRTAGLFAPSQAAQEALLAQACADAGVDPGEVDYAEVHGTGTKSGDRVEGRALAAVLAARRTCDAPLLVGSVKTNLGHLEGAAGVAGLAKAALMLYHGRIPPALHHHRIRPALAELALRVPTRVEPWPTAGHRRTATVCAFGFGGTNGAAVLCAPDAPARPGQNPGGLGRDAAHDRAAYLVPLSAPSAPRLRGTAQRWAACVAGEDLAAVAGTAIHRRDVDGPHRAAVIAADPATAAEALQAVAEGRAHPDAVAPGPASPRDNPRPLVWMFPGHGSQTPAMAARCHQRFPAFAEAFDTASEALADHTGEGPWRPGTPITGFAAAQQAIWLTQVSLAALWRHWGYEPAAVVGHSVGEIAAAHTAGALPLDQAARLLAVRCAHLAAAAHRGGLLVVDLPAEDTRQAITAAGYPRDLVIAALNGASTTVISGGEHPLERMRAWLGARGTPARRVAADTPAHSPLVADAAARLGADLAPHLTPRTPRIALYSTLSRGGQRPTAPRLDAAYWADQAACPVDFLGALRAIAADLPGATVLEIAGCSTLAADTAETLHHHTPAAHVVAAGRRDTPDDAAVLTQLAHLYARAHTPARWPHPRRAPARLDLYWQRTDPTRNAPGTSTDTAEAAAARLHTAAPPHRDEAMAALLRAVAAEITRTPPEAIPADSPLADLGVSSIAVLELRERLRTLLHLPHLPARLLVEHPTIAALAPALAELPTTPTTSHTAEDSA